jgi:translation initiation factor 2B subunit (eIF-2B alpha/beta/delta family)
MSIYEVSTVRELVSIIEERNESLRREQEYSASLYKKLQYVLTTHVETEDGYYTFDDGDTWSCRGESST